MRKLSFPPFQEDHPFHHGLQLIRIGVIELEQANAGAVVSSVSFAGVPQGVIEQPLDSLELANSASRTRTIKSHTTA